MSLRCKFSCSMIQESPSHYDYLLSPVFPSKSSPENTVFWDATPSGSFRVVVAKNKGKLFTCGRDYYLDISEVGE